MADGIHGRKRRDERRARTLKKHDRSTFVSELLTRINTDTVEESPKKKSIVAKNTSKRKVEEERRGINSSAKYPSQISVRQEVF